MHNPPPTERPPRPPPAPPRKGHGMNTRIHDLTRELGQQARDYERRITELEDELAAAQEGLEGQTRNTLAFQDEATVYKTAFLAIGATIAMAGCCTHRDDPEDVRLNNCTREKLMKAFLSLRGATKGTQASGST